MQLLQKKQQRERERRKNILLKIIGLIICTVAPILAYLISPTKIVDEDFLNLLAWILLLIAAAVLSVDDSVTWWLITCFYVAFWHVMLVGVPFYGLENLHKAGYGDGLAIYFISNFGLAIILSGVLGILFKLLIRINLK